MPKNGKNLKVYFCFIRDIPDQMAELLSQNRVEIICSDILNKIAQRVKDEAHTYSNLFRRQLDGETVRIREYTVYRLVTDGTAFHMKLICDGNKNGLKGYAYFNRNLRRGDNVY